MRDESYLDWRYGNPLCEYRFLYAGGSTLDGYLVLKRATDRHLPSPRVMIVDLEAVNSQIRAILLKTAVSHGAFSELAIWTATVNEQMQEQLRELEFRPIDEELASSGRPVF